MTVVINPGSGPVPEHGDGWTNTLAGAQAEAQRWLQLIEDAGIRDVILLPGHLDAGDGRWEFSYGHTVTGKVVTLDTHGVDNVTAYERDRIFSPRVYWDGSSTAEPEIEQWLADGFEVVKTLRPKQVEP